MKPLKTILRIPLLLLIVWLGSVTAYQVMSTIRDGGWASLAWQSWAYAGEGALEVAVLVAIYRWLERPAAVSTAQGKAASA